MASKVNVTIAGEPRPLIAYSPTFPHSTIMVKEVRVFSKYTELAMLAFLHCLNIENKLDVVIGHINFNAKHYDKCKLAFKI